MDRPARVARAVVLFISLNLILNLLLVTYFGLAGAATATTLSFSVMLLVILNDVNDLIDLSVDWLDHAISFVAALGMAAGLLVLQMLINIDSLVKLLSVVGFGGVLYFALLLVPNRTRERAIELTDGLIK
jgi:O-antigen/teichoic acid export membrane protein